MFKTISTLGGENGWLVFEWARKLRGILDRLVGGMGFHRGRRSATEPRVADALDFWRVEAIGENELLKLRAEMKVAGRAWLEFQVKDEGGGMTKLTQSVYLAPKGLFGLFYWYGLYPIHSLIFSSMIEYIGREAEKEV